ncbi:MAG: metallophosphoesterase [Hyphomicrobium sp.]
MRIASVILPAGLLTMSMPALAESYQWVQYTHAGLEARLTTSDSACPAIRIDGATSVMSVHAAPGPEYPVTTCKIVLPAGAKAASIADVPLALPKADPQRIVVIGDTGCRIKGKKAQACNDPVQWPFRLVAEMAAHQKPDLIVHVGDYHYRETACPEGFVGCEGTPFGDNWAVWRADFFAPGDTLLRAAPWIMTRGNHEECNRGGKGWSRTLEPTAFDADKGCNGMSTPFSVALPNLAIAVMDVSTASEEKVDETEAATFRAQFATLADKGPTWLALHRPIWSAEEVEKGVAVGDNRTLAAAALGTIPKNVNAMLSGHHHSFQVFNYDADLPVQITSGHGGDYLDKGTPLDPAGFVINGVTIKSGINVPKKFGFSMFEKQASGDWSILNYDAYGKVLTRCTLSGRQAVCAPVG